MRISHAHAAAPLRARSTYVAHLYWYGEYCVRTLSFRDSLARTRALLNDERGTRRLIIHMHSCSTIGSNASNYRPAAQDDDAWMKEQDRMIANMLAAASLGTVKNYI